MQTTIPIQTSVTTITSQISAVVQRCILLAYPNIEIDITKFVAYRGTKTDYQFNQIGALAKIFGLSATIVAETIHNKLFNNPLIEFVETICTEKQILLIFNVHKIYLQDILNKLYTLTVLNNGIPPPPQIDIPQKILIDFSSPNIAKEMHVGHLRSTIIGESLCRVFEYCGSQTRRINHIGDWGTQFGMVIAYIKKYTIKEYDISILMTIYKESRKLFDTDIEFNKSAHMETVQLQHGLPENIAIWKSICDTSMCSFNKIYLQLGTYLEVRGESFYQNHMIKLMEDLDSIIIKDSGMKIVFATGMSQPYILAKSDGGFTYDTSDLAAIHYRLFEEKADQIIYVVDSGQQQHFEILFQLAKDLGWTKNTLLKYVNFGLVLGADGKKLKTRSGETIKLQDLLDQAYISSNNCTKKLAKERHPNWDDQTIDTISKKIAINCIKYSDLSSPRQSDYKFNLDKMLNVKGNTAVYLMYALARCKAIIRKIPNIENIAHGDIILDSIESRNLAFKLARYPEIINDTITQLAPHHLCNYLYDLVNLLSKFYLKDRCIDFNDKGEIIHIYDYRVRLINLVMFVITKLFDLIGLEQIEEM